MIDSDGGLVSGRTDPPDAMMEPNAVSLSLLLAKMRLDICVPMNSVPVNPVSVPMLGDVKQELPV